jgi:hypothetical protein
VLPIDGAGGVDLYSIDLPAFKPRLWAWHSWCRSLVRVAAMRIGAGAALQAWRLWLINFERPYLPPCSLYPNPDDSNPRC